MKILAINSALPFTEIALLNGDEVVLNESWPSNFDEVEKLLPAIQKALELDGKIDKLLVVTGPGAFTGLRVGVTIANTLAFAQSVPIISVSTFDYLHHKIGEEDAPKTAIMLRAGSGVAMKLSHEEKVRTMKKEEIQNFLSDQKAIQYIVSDIKEEARENYQLSKGIQWQEYENLRTLPDSVKEIMAQNPPEHQQVKPASLLRPISPKVKSRYLPKRLLKKKYALHCRYTHWKP